MSTQRVSIQSDYHLEGVLRPNSGKAGVVICHPHPLYGGDMHSNVVEAIEKGFSTQGFTTLKFNFRGVGASGGSYDEGRGEVNDVMAALSFLRDATDENPYVMLAGYSFGAWVAGRAARHINDLRGLFLVAYPLAFFYESNPLEKFQGKIYLVGGERDDVCPMDRLLAVYKEIPVIEKYLKIIPTDHFYGGKEGEITEFIKEHVQLPDDR